MVRSDGLEPSRLSAYAPQAYVSTSSTTIAFSEVASRLTCNRATMQPENHRRHKAPKLERSERNDLAKMTQAENESNLIQILTGLTSTPS